MWVTPKSPGLSVVVRRRRRTPSSVVVVVAVVRRRRTSSSVAVVRRRRGWGSLPIYLGGHIPAESLVMELPLFAGNGSSIDLALGALIKRY